MYDLRRPIEEDGEIEIITPDRDEALEVLRHSTAHLMAQAIKRLYKNVKLGVGPVIEGGFYYDIDLEESLTPDDLPRIEKEMKKIVNENLEIVRKEVSREEAVKLYKEIGDEYKLELIEAIPAGEKVTIYEQGEFFDLCRGVHVPSTGKIKEFKLLSIAGAYWRGDSNNKMLQRIYGTAFFKRKTSRNICVFWKKRKNATIASLEKSLTYLQTHKRLDRGCRSGFQKVQQSAV